MVFSSMYFIFIFLPAVIFSYYAVKLLFPQKIFVRNLLLCLASLFFYAWGEPVYIFLMLVSIICNYLFALSSKKAVFVCAVIFNLIFLFFFKYSGFAISTVNSIFGISIPVPELTLPIGISFYTFQALSYVIDVHRKKVQPQKSIISLALYISLFPQLIAGPIVRYIDIEKELKDRKEDFLLFIDGLKTFMTGLGAKVILANNLASFADNIYARTDVSCTGILWLAALCYSFQIYFDFSGYSRMAIGLGKMFGFSFPENFNHPYCASSITDFWRRWHITLSVWFRDYVYIPLGGNKVKTVFHIRNILVTWLLTGLWHGASWNFVLWGLYYGLLLLVEKFLVFPLIKKTEGKKGLHFSFSVIMRILTLALVLFGWILFRLEDLQQLVLTLQKMFSSSNVSLITYISENADVCSKLIFLIPAVIFSTPLYGKMFRKSDSSAFVFILELVFAFLVFAVSVSMLLASTYNPFIYFRF